MHYNITRLDPFGVMVEPIAQPASVQIIDIEALRALFKIHQLVLLRGFDSFATNDDLATYCEQWGDISIWPFGKVLELVQQDKPDDHIFDNNYMPMHWDGMYRPQVPEYQIFQCVSAPETGHGGRTTFSHTVLALEYASETEIALWEKITATYEREMAFYNSRTTSLIITQHPYLNHAVIRYNEPHLEEKGVFINPSNMAFSGITETESQEFHASLRASLYDPRCFYAHEWQTGDLVISDNFNLLHGREAFTSNTPRHLRRVHINANPVFENPNLESYQ
ncbi:TauD/TfdA family dioxygenase [Shewanella psychropiezotolerans]|uniref:TauD/TfdA family dioxygenase n=1 Tax=Shewanella psychropiezotolerans TaxID=2593655 RepID=A0ABX5WYZ1_9GAMM|nr:MULTISPECIES: TauD/TfdA family dioxygenase [Shewanella]MPY24082.1 TauD/TfdA family dioxygenase [Shewanella sp. YLB-07]QDO84327.1 TauD/TfdA family dioxygenase [Shewanella psychropiezotolerans]